ncbi:MAG: glycosyltransferase family 2 protein [Bacteroidales bacterium]|nr:glycosyltransferase family 2 protein [Bacteroidales bacterium]
MISGKKIAVVLPAYNAEKTLRQTCSEIPPGLVDILILTDDKSDDRTLEIAQELSIDHIIRHDSNRGYGANQKSCYNKALESGADIIVMLHPDYQYTPLLIPAMCHMVASGLYDVVLGSRILGKGALKGGMPLYKYVANRVLTFVQNIFLNQKLSEYHTGYRAFSAEILRKLRYNNNSDDYIFDNEILAQVIFLNGKIGEISCPTKYTKESSSIGFLRSIYYGTRVIFVSLGFILHKAGLIKCSLFVFDEEKDNRAGKS